jgi:hypothetical protein
MTALFTFLILLATLTMAVLMFSAGTAGGGAETDRRYRAARPIMVVAGLLVVASAVGLLLVEQ